MKGLPFGRSVMTCIVLMIAFSSVSCDEKKKATEFLFEKMPDGIKIESYVPVVSGNGDLLVGLKLICSEQQLLEYLLALKIQQRDLEEVNSLGWDPGVAAVVAHSGSSDERKWSYFSSSERRKVLASWNDGYGYVQYETY